MEGFALAKDRTAFLDRLVKGSDDHFYYTILDLLQRNTDGNLTAEINDTLDRYSKSTVANHIRLTNLKTRAKYVSLPHLSRSCQKTLLIICICNSINSINLPRLLSFDHGSAEEKKGVFEWLVKELSLTFSASPELVNTIAATEEEAARYPTKLDNADVFAFTKQRELYEYNASAYPYLIKKKEELLRDVNPTPQQILH